MRKAENGWGQLRRAGVVWEEKRQRERTQDEIMMWKRFRKYDMTWDDIRWDVRCEMKWKEIGSDEMTWSEIGSKEMRWDVRCEVKWEEIGSDEMRWNETGWSEMRWDVKCEMKSEEIGPDKWHDKSRNCCCDAQKACPPPLGTVFARLYRL
jgi:hypothetical protein